MRNSTQTNSKAAYKNLLPIIFCVFIFIPISYEIAGIRLSLYRIFLLTFIGISLKEIITNNEIKIRLIDVSILLFCIWVSISYSVVENFEETWQIISYTTLETLGPYSIARAYIRTPKQLKGVANTLFALVLLHLSPAIYETVTGRNTVLEIWQIIGTNAIDQTNLGQRLGLDRVQGPFEHPIHFGMITGSLIGMTYYIAMEGRKFPKRISGTIAVLLCSTLSLSSGPLSSAIIQLGMIFLLSYVGRSRAAWMTILIFAAMVYIVIDLGSSRGALKVIFSYFAFSAETAYGRIDIWYWGWRNIWLNPLFGIGLKDWIRADHMTASFDMYWLIYALQNGIPAGLMQITAYFAGLIVVMKTKQTEEIEPYTLGWIVTMTGIFITGWMVHFWNAPYAFVMFIMGSGIWISEYQGTNPNCVKTASPKNTQRRHLYTRYEPKNKTAQNRTAHTKRTKAANDDI